MTAVVTLILTLGIGATARVFSIRNSVFFRPQPYPAPESMVLAGEIPMRDGRPSTFGGVRYSNSPSGEIKTRSSRIWQPGKWPG